MINGIDIRCTNASAAEFILYRLKLYLDLAGRRIVHLTRVCTEEMPALEREVRIGAMAHLN